MQFSNHYFYNNEQFLDEVKNIRLRFHSTSDNYLFSHTNTEKNVLAEDLNLYCTKIWTTILNEKDLNIVKI